MLQKLPDITFLAEALDDPFIDVRIVTLKSHVETKVKHDALWPNKITPTIKAKQFIRIEPNKIVIVIDAEKVDEQAIDDALSLLVRADRSEGYYEFGETITYDCNEFLNDTDIN